MEREVDVFVARLAGSSHAEIAAHLGGVAGEVVDTGDGWVAAEGVVAAVMVVEVEPRVELAASLGF